MATLADSLIATSTRKLPLRMRPDLKVQAVRTRGKTWWVVKDPVALEYFRLREEEYSILKRLDGNVSLEELKEAFDKRFAPRHISLNQIHWFLGQLHSMGLIAASAPGQGWRLLKRRGEKRKKKMWAALANIMAVRFRGFDPEWMLEGMNRWLGWFFSPWCVTLCLALIASAAALVTVQFDVFQSKLPEFNEFFSGENAGWLILTLAFSKIIHEFGHGLLCKHFGGECHEIGVMLLVFTPALYCNVTDSWMLPSKWQRAAIAAGGIYVELVLASICTYLWWFTEPGLLNYLCLNVMFISSVSTIMFNANPLLRYDGYYMLSDLSETPNLWEKSRAVLNYYLCRWCLGLSSKSLRALPEESSAWLALYAVASAAYRWVVTLSILWFVHEVLKPYRLELIAQILAISGLYSLAVAPLWKAFKFLTAPGRTRDMKKGRALLSAALLVGAVVLVSWLPLPHRVTASLVVEPRDAHRVYVEAPGVLKTVYVEPGRKVEQGALLAELEDLALRLEIAQLETDRGRQIIQIRSLERIERLVPGESSQIAKKAPARKRLEEIEHQLRLKRLDEGRLQLKAGASGLVLPPPAHRSPPDPNGGLPKWSGLPTEPKNKGAFLEPRTLFCLIGDPSQVEAVMVVDQSQIDFVYVGQTVEVLLDELPGEVLTGKVSGIAVENMTSAPEQLSANAGGGLATRTDRAGVERLLRTSYKATVDLDDPNGRFLPGFRGRAKIHARSMSLGTHVARYLSETFHFRL